MAERQTALLDDEDGEEVLKEIGSAGAGQGPRGQQTQNNDRSDDVEIILEDGEDQDDGGDADTEDQGESRDTRFTEEDQPGASYLDQQAGVRSKSVRRREGRERTEAEKAQLRAKLAASDARFAAVEAEVARLRTFAGRVEPQLAQFSEAQLQNKLANVDGQITRTATELDTAEKAIAAALSENDSEAVLKAMRARDQAFIAGEKLRNEKAQISTAIAASTKERGTDGGKAAAANEDQGGGRQQQQQLPPKANAYMREFLGRFSWASPNAKDPRDRRDAKIVAVLDDEVMSEGFDPSDPSYWRELESRMREALPTRMGRAPQARRESYSADTRQERQPPARTERRGPPTAAPGTGGGPRGKVVVRLTPERREALQQAGVIDEAGNPVDKVKFTNIARQYAELDRANGAGQ